jgi:hypothetical protein
MASILRTLWARFTGHNEPTEAAPADAVEYKRCRIRAAPYETAGGYQTAGVIEKDFTDGVREHRFVRAEAHPSRDDAAAFGIAKGKQIIDQHGDRVTVRLGASLEEKERLNALLKSSAVSEWGHAAPTGCGSVTRGMRPGSLTTSELSRVPRIVPKSTEGDMDDRITVRETFSSRDEAEEARERLEYGGFARNSMNIMRGDQFELSIHTRPENRDRVQECIEGSDFMFEARRYGRQISEHAPSPGQTALLVGVIGAVGAALYYAYTRSRDLHAATYSSRERSAVRRLYEAHREEHERGTAPRHYADRSPGLRSDAASYGA